MFTAWIRAGTGAHDENRPRAARAERPGGGITAASAATTHLSPEDAGLSVDEEEVEDDGLLDDDEEDVVDD